MKTNVMMSNCEDISNIMESTNFRKKHHGNFWCKVPLTDTYIGVKNEDTFEVHYFSSEYKCLEWLQGDDEFKEEE